MRIAPIDIAHKNFSKKFMGFDSEEVIEFLREMADQMEELIRERNSLKETLREKELNILEYRERDETLKTTITTATRMAEQIRIDAEREAKLIMHDANQKAEMIVKDARDSLKRIYQEVGEMKRARIQFEANLRSIAQAHLAMLDQSHQIMPDYQTQNMNWAMSQGNNQPDMFAQQNSNPQQNMQSNSQNMNSQAINTQPMNSQQQQTQQNRQQQSNQMTQTQPAQAIPQQNSQQKSNNQPTQGGYNFGLQNNSQTMSAGYPINGIPQKPQASGAANNQSSSGVRTATSETARPARTTTTGL